MSTRPSRASKSAAADKMKKEMEEEKAHLKKRRFPRRRHFEENEDEDEEVDQKMDEELPKKKHKSMSSSSSKTKNQNENNNGNSQDPASFFELLKLPKPCLTIIVGYLDSKSIMSLTCTSKQFSWIKSDRTACIAVVSRFISKKVSQQSLHSEWCHEAYLGGWLADCYSNFISQEADERNLEWHSNNNIPDGRTFATCFGHEDISTEEMDQFENLLEEIHLWSPERNAIYTYKCFRNLLPFSQTVEYQTYSRLLSYAYIAPSEFQLVNLHARLDELKPRQLNDIEKKLFDVFDDPILEVGKVRTQGPFVRSFDGFLTQLEEIFDYSSWKEEMDWDAYFLVGGSVLKCLLKEPFETKESQDLDFFAIGQDYNEAQMFVTEFADKMGKKFKRVKKDQESNGYVRTFHFERKNKPDLTFQFIWYDMDIQRNWVLQIFDLDCCQIGFDGEDCMATPAFIQSLCTGTMINYKLINSSRDVSTFLPRTLKYAKRGFRLLVPKKFDTDVLITAIENPLKPDEMPSVKSGYTGFLLNNDTMDVKQEFVEILQKMVSRF